MEDFTMKRQNYGGETFLNAVSSKAKNMVR
jgi:hypothetical protein